MKNKINYINNEPLEFGNKIQIKYIKDFELQEINPPVKIKATEVTETTLEAEFECFVKGCEEWIYFDEAMEDCNSFDAFLNVDKDEICCDSF